MPSFADIRLSERFSMLDFMHCNAVYNSGQKFTPDSVPESVREYGSMLCQTFLEPIVDRFGPISISAGWLPRDLSGGRVTPHFWNEEWGAAADIVIHDLANNDIPPIKIIDMLAQELDFDRMISYAGSEFICVAVRRTRNRRIIYENVRLPSPGPGLVAKPEVLTWTESKRNKADNWPPERPDWRRVEGEPIYHSRRTLRAQHIRVSHYFTALDFCRDEDAMASGRSWVPERFADSVMDVLRAAGDILDPLAEKHGFVSILRGPSYATQGDYKVVGPNRAITLTFRLPEGPQLLHRVTGSPHCLALKRINNTDYTLTFSMYEPENKFSSAVME